MCMYVITVSHVIMLYLWKDLSVQIFQLIWWMSFLLRVYLFFTRFRHLYTYVSSECCISFIYYADSFLYRSTDNILTVAWCTAPGQHSNSLHGVCNNSFRVMGRKTHDSMRAGHAIFIDMIYDMGLKIICYSSRKAKSVELYDMIFMQIHELDIK